MLSWLLIVSIISFISTYRLVGHTGIHQQFIQRHLSGGDLNKPGRPILPESMGVLCGLVYLVSMFILIPASFIPHLPKIPPRSPTPTLDNDTSTMAGHEFAMLEFPYDRLSSYLSGLLSLTCMLLLGFADDVLDLRWRFKLLLPTIASIPLLMVYATTYGVTTIVIPRPVRAWFHMGRTGDLGVLYYVYMGMLAVFCTNSINILSGINGVEVGQTLIIALSIVANDLLYLVPAWNWIVDPASLSPEATQNHTYSLYLMAPFVAVVWGLYLRNRFPAQVFVGDTFCYFAGMSFAVVGILGKFSKTVLLFFVPQIFNFVYSLPQLMRWVPCPRHRLPRFEQSAGVLYPSVTEVGDRLLGRWVLRVFNLFGLVQLYKVVEMKRKKNMTFKRVSSVSEATHASNLTLLNLILVRVGPMHEGTLCRVLMAVQLVCSLGAFFIRYGLVGFAYP